MASPSDRKYWCGSRDGELHTAIRESDRMAYWNLQRADGPDLLFIKITSPEKKGRAFGRAQLQDPQNGR